MKRYFVYILASYKNGTMYVGVTSKLENRVTIHQRDIVDGFTKRFKVHSLVHIEEFSSPIEAIAREKQIKHWTRKWKVELIEKQNPNWDDLSEELNTL